MVDYCFGLPMLGWARHSPTMVQRTSVPPRAERPSREAIAAEHALALERAKPSRDHEADENSWSKSEKELTEHTMLGPY